MKKRLFNKLIILFNVFLLLACLSVGGNKPTAKADKNSIPITSGKHEKWIDRIDLSSAQYARDFYVWLVENTDNDGEEDVLIDFSEEQHELSVIEQSFTVDVSQGDVETLVSQELTRLANINFEEVVDYCSMVYAAFNRDYNEVFWLKREMYSLNSLTCSYSSTGEATFTQTITLLIKNDNPSDDIRDFDMRKSVYIDGTLDIRQEIERVNDAITTIISGIEKEATYYEKVRYFNKWLTENNCYAKTDSENSRDCRGALLGQDGNSQYAPVCEGYARAFKVLCDRAKIPCVLSSGNASGEPHMWNLVQMENGSWYAVDVTWNDPTVSGVTSQKSGAENEDFLLVGRTTVIDGDRFAESHVEINKAYEDGVALDNGPSLTVSQYGAPVEVESWDVSKTIGVDSIVAKLYQSQDYTIVNPTYKLIISGNGDVIEFLNESDCPWASYVDKIIEVEIRVGVQSLSGFAFKGLTNLEKVYVYSDLTFEEQSFENGDFTFICHKNFECYQKAEDLGFNVEMICGFTNWSILTPQACEQDQILQSTCEDCGHVTTKIGEVAYGHDYTAWAISLVPTTNTEGEITRVCNNDNSHVEKFDLPVLNEVDYVYSVTENPKCEVVGKCKYVYVKDGENIEIECDIQPIGHDFSIPTYNWDYIRCICIATRVCNNDSNHIETEESIASTDREVDCSTSGYVTFRAEFSNEAFAMQEKTEYLTARPHEFNEEFSFDENSHWHSCHNCNSKKDLNSHDFTEWKTQKEATLFSQGLRSRECECGYLEEEEIAKVNFFEALFSGNLSGDMKFILIVGGTLIGIIIISIIIKKVIKKRG